MNRFWISWYETKDLDDNYHAPEDERPGLISYWQTGSLRDCVAICAVVEATSCKAAKQVILDAGWRPLAPWHDESGWRFCLEKPPGWTPEGDRFK